MMVLRQTRKNHSNCVTLSSSGDTKELVTQSYQDLELENYRTSRETKTKTGTIETCCSTVSFKKFDFPWV